MMWRIAVKRVLKNPLFLVMLVFLSLCVLFFGSIEREIVFPKSGITVRDDDAAALYLQQALANEGFAVYPDEESMCDAIRREEVAVGVAIKEGLTERLQAGKPEECTVLYCTPTASFIKVASLRVSAHLSELYAPYITERMMAQQGITLSHQEVRAYMERCFETDAQFEFSFNDTQGKPLQESNYSKSLIYGLFAVLLFCLFMLCSCTEKDDAYRNLHDRLGVKSAFWRVLMPSVAVKYLIAFLTVGGTALLCRHIYGTDIEHLFWQCAVYLLFLCGISALLYAAVYRFATAQLYVLALALLSLGICPIFVDLTAYAALPEALKCLLPPYFFYKISSAPVTCTVAAVSVCIVGFALLYRREAHTPPRTRV